MKFALKVRYRAFFTHALGFRALPQRGLGFVSLRTIGRISSEKEVPPKRTLLVRPDHHHVQKDLQGNLETNGLRVLKKVYSLEH